MERESFLRALPKVETHVHLDGSLSPALVRELARRQGHAPLRDLSLEELERRTVVREPRESLAAVLKAFETYYPLLRSAEALERAAEEQALAAARQTILYFETRFAPALQAGPGLTVEGALAAALRGLERGRERGGAPGAVIVSLYRGLGPEENREMLEAALRFRGRGVVGVDLAGDEASRPLSDFAELFRRAKGEGLALTVHAGEVPGSRDLELALELGVDRLGHATLLSGELEREVRRRGLPIEVNLTSNLLTGAVRSVASHPARRWFEAGIPLALSTDDPGVFGLSLDHEYGLLLDELGFSEEEARRVARTGVDCLFLPEAGKASLRAEFNRRLAAL